MKKEELEDKIKELEKEYKVREKVIKQSQEFVDLDKRYNKLDKENDILNEKKQEIKDSVYTKFLDDARIPCYSKSDNYGNRRNINQEVLNSIKRSLGIKNLSLLKGSDIEKITQKLIDKEINENQELKGISNKLWKNREIGQKLEKERGKLLEVINPLDKELWKLRQELSEVERREARMKEMENPKKKAYEDRRKKKYEVVKKLKENFSEIVEKVRIEVIKEKIVNNLENEED